MPTRMFCGVQSRCTTPSGAPVVSSTSSCAACNPLKVSISMRSTTGIGRSRCATDVCDKSVASVTPSM